MTHDQITVATTPEQRLTRARQALRVAMQELEAPAVPTERLYGATLVVEHALLDLRAEIAARS